MSSVYLSEAWGYFCNRLEFAISFSIVQQFSPATPHSYTGYILQLVVVTFGVIAIYSNAYTRSNNTLVIILQLVLADCFASTLPIMDTNAESGVVLLAHVLFYITLISAALSWLGIITEIVPAYAEFVHGISPYTILYAVGVCIPRLEGSAHLLTSLLAFACYSAARLHARQEDGAADSSSSETRKSTLWYLVHFLDYIGDRIIMLSFNKLCVALFGSDTLSLCAAYVTATFALARPWAKEWPVLQTYKTLAAMTLAQSVFAIVQIDNSIKFILFAALVLAPDVVCGELTWYAQVAIISFCIAVMERIDMLIHSLASGWAEKAFVSVALVIFLGHITPTPDTSEQSSSSKSKRFHNAKIGLPATR